MKFLDRQDRSRSRLLDAAVGWAALVGAAATQPYRLSRPCVNRAGTPVVVVVTVHLEPPPDPATV